MKEERLWPYRVYVRAEKPVTEIVVEVDMENGPQIFRQTHTMFGLDRSLVDMDTVTLREIGIAFFRIAGDIDRQRVIEDNK